MAITRTPRRSFTTRRWFGRYATPVSWFWKGLAGEGVSGPITGTGALLAQAAVIDGAGLSSSAGTGVLLAQASDITGVGVAEWTGIGSLLAAQASMAGTGLSSSHSTFGALLAAPATIVGTGTVGSGATTAFWFNYDQKF